MGPRIGTYFGSVDASSTSLIGTKAVLPDKTAGSIISNKGAHCWGYIQGICPHLDKHRYFHPGDIVPCALYVV